jgi:hypothetical protein
MAGSRRGMRHLKHCCAWPTVKWITFAERLAAAMLRL